MVSDMQGGANYGAKQILCTIRYLKIFKLHSYYYYYLKSSDMLP